MVVRIANICEKFDDIYEIYREAFPACEQRTREGQREAMLSPFYRLLAWDEGGRIAAFLGYWDLSSCVFIEHLATTPAGRGRGYGKELALCCIRDTKKPIFLEIEPVTEENPMTARRASFYERLGFYCNHFPYLQLPLKAGDSPCPLWVMSHGKTVTEDEFLPYKQEIYRTVYRLPDGRSEQEAGYYFGGSQTWN